jgi:hypothetical protein
MTKSVSQRTNTNKSKKSKKQMEAEINLLHRRLRELELQKPLTFKQLMFIGMARGITDHFFSMFSNPQRRDVLGNRSEDMLND